MTTTKKSSTKKAVIKPRRTKNSSATKHDIFEAAKIRFSHASYDEVGVREIADDAGVDKALVIRYYGSKENLFREIAAQAFSTKEILKSDGTSIAEGALELLLTGTDDKAWREGYDSFRLLLNSISSAIAGPILADYFNRHFTVPLAKALKGKHTVLRARLLASYIMGFALLRVATSFPASTSEEREIIRHLLGDALNASINEGSLRTSRK